MFSLTKSHGLTVVLWVPDLFVKEFGWSHSTLEVDRAHRNVYFVFFPPPQTGCNPTSAFASFSKRPPSPLQEDSLFTDSLSPFYSPQHLASKFASLSYGPPPGPAEGTVVIPCEFCGVLLEDDLLFHHQVNPP